MSAQGLNYDLATSLKLLRLSLFSIINESSFPVALFFELALIARALPRENLAAYAAISATCTFVLNIFNFLVTVTMAQVSKAVGGNDWRNVGRQFLIAVLTAIFVGTACAFALFYLREHVFYIMGLSESVQNIAATPYNIRLITIPFMMVQRVCSGCLSGYMRLKSLASLAVVVSIVEVFSQFYALEVLRGGLLEATIGRLVTSIFGSVLAMVLVVLLPPERAQGAIEICQCCHRRQSTEKENSELLSTVLLDDGDETETGGNCTETFVEYFTASRDTTIRSVLLTGSVYAMSVVAGNLGTDALAAHQIVLTLWMVTSYFCDGFADVGTMLGAKLLAGSDPGKFKQVIVLRNLLLLYGISTGLVAGLVLFAFEDDIFTLFHVHDGHTKDILILVWPILSFMQIINACVFVLDGLIYAAQAFSFVRNLMFVACVLVFSPAIFVVTTVSAYHSLFYLWIGKTCLNSVRAVGAFWLWFYSFPSSWRSERRVNSAPPIG